METVLDGASTWFLESFSQGPYGALIIRVVEGVRSEVPDSVEVGGTTLGPCTRIEVTPESRCAEIRFEQAFGFFTQREQFDATDSAMEFEEHRGFVRQLRASSLRDFAKATTGITAARWGEVLEFHVWTEEQLFQVFAIEPPRVEFVASPPDLGIDRGDTFVAG